MKTKKLKTVLVDIQGGNVQYTSVPDGVELIIRDFDNCSTCGGEFCQGGWIEPCPKSVKEARAGLIPHDPKDDEPETEGVR